MNTFCVGDFAHSVLFYAAAWAVIKALGTVLHADEFVLGQPAVTAAAAGDQKFFQQPVAGGFVLIGIVKEFAAETVFEFFGFTQLQFYRSGSGRWIVKGVGAAQYAVVESEVVERHAHFQFGLIVVVFVEPLLKTFEFFQRGTDTVGDDLRFARERYAVDQNSGNTHQSGSCDLKFQAAVLGGFELGAAAAEFLLKLTAEIFGYPHAGNFPGDDFFDPVRGQQSYPYDGRQIEAVPQHVPEQSLGLKHIPALLYDREFRSGKQFFAEIIQTADHGRCPVMVGVDGCPLPE